MRQKLPKNVILKYFFAVLGLLEMKQKINSDTDITDYMNANED